MWEIGGTKDFGWEHTNWHWPLSTWEKGTDTSENGHPISVDAPNEAESMVVSMSAPRTAKTKGSKQTGKEIEHGDAGSSLSQTKKRAQDSAKRVVFMHGIIQQHAR
jgi:hypothetical protein